MSAAAPTYTGIGLIRVHVALMNRRERLALVKQFLIAAVDIYDYDRCAVLAQRLGLYSVNTPVSQVADSLERIQQHAVRTDPEFKRELLKP